MLYKSFDTFVFDYDGTLFDSQPHALNVFKKIGAVAIERGYLNELWCDDTITSVIGHNPIVTWQTLLPNTPESERAGLSSLYSQFMSDELSATQTQWYQDAESVISTLLQEGKHCVLLTNARRYYVDIAVAQHPLLLKFQNVVCAQDYDYLEKHKILPQLSLNGKVVVIGDKKDDALAAQSINAPSIWAKYGYGTLEKDGIFFDETINSVHELLVKPS